jgi:uncharacterized protein HemY
VKIDQLDKSLPVRTKIEDLDGLASALRALGRSSEADEVSEKAKQLAQSANDRSGQR